MSWPSHAGLRPRAALADRTPVQSGERSGPEPHPRRRARPERAFSPLLASSWILLSSAFGLAACSPTPIVPTDAAVSIDGEEIPYREFESYVREQVDEEGLELDSAALSALFDQFLDEQLLIRLAIERGLVEGEVDEKRALAFLLRDTRRDWSRAEIEGYYRAHLGGFERQEQVHLRQILTEERTRAEEALQALSTSSFEEVAARFSQGPTAHLGGDQGILTREDLSPTYADLIFALQPGTISEVIEAEYGFQIFQVVERFPASTITLEEAEPTIRRELHRLSLDEQVASLHAEALERYNVTVFKPNIPFDYRVSHGQSHDP